MWLLLVLAGYTYSKGAKPHSCFHFVLLVKILIDML